MNGATRVRTTHRSEYWHVNNVFERENTRVVMAERNNALFQYATNLEKKSHKSDKENFQPVFFFVLNQKTMTCKETAARF